MAIESIGSGFSYSAALEKIGTPPVNNSCPDGKTLIDTETSKIATNSNSCNSIASCIAEVVYVFTVGLGGAVAYLAAWVFSLAVALSLSSTAYALTFITDGWTIMRDLANMMFVLILVYLALTIMFRADTHDTAKKLAWVIVIALVINFSFFFTRVVIDAGNLLAVQFYNSIKAPAIGETAKESPLSGSEVTTITGGEATKDLTYSIMSGVGVHKIMGSDSFEAFQGDRSGITGFIAEFLVLAFIYITVGAMMFMLAAAFFAVAIKFMVRIVVLWLLIVASPIAFVANTLNEGRHWYKRWQSELIKHTFYPAFFLFIFYILTLFMEELTKGGSILEQAFGENLYRGDNFTFLISTMASVVIRLGFVLALIYIGLKASEQMGVMGANFANSVAGRVTSFGRFSSGLPMRGALAGTAAGGRTVVGGTAQKVSRSSLVQNLRADSMFGRAVKSGLRGLSTASYDARGIPGASTALGAGGLLNIGKAGGKGGYTQKMKDRATLIENAAKDMKPDEVDVRNAQAAYQKQYDAEHGAGAYAARVGDLTAQKAAAERQASAWESSARQSAGNPALEKEYRDRAAVQRKEAKRIEELLKPMQEAGKKTAEADAKDRIKRLAERMGERNVGNLGMPSRGSIVGAAKALKLVSEKSTRDKLADAAKQLAKEEGGDDEPTPPTGGGGGGSAGAGGGSGTTKASGGATTGSHGTGTKSSMEEHTEKMVSATERMAQRLERTMERGFHGLGEQLHQENKHTATRAAMQGTSQHINQAQAATRPVAAVPTGGNVAVPPKPPVQQMGINTPQTTPKPAVNDNIPPNFRPPTQAQRNAVPTPPEHANDNARHANDNLHIDNDRKAA